MTRSGCIVLALLAACGDNLDPPTTPSVVETGDACGGVITTVPLEFGAHHEVGTPLTWTSNPPTSGPHWPVWAAWDRSYTQLARGHWVHNLEHGGVVFAYRCEVDCPEIVEQLVAVVTALPTDPLCASPIRQRAQIIADPELPADGTVAAVAWGVHYTGSCVDAQSLAAFYDEHTARAPENLCGNGAALGGTPLF
jgi:hypothetical protein